MTRAPGLSADDSAAFARDGYLVVPGFLDAPTCEGLAARARALVEGFDPETVSIFSTKDQASTSDAYFLGSGDDVRFFFEEEAFLPGGALRQEKALSINKIGHALHDRDPVFSAFSRSPAIQAVIADLGLARPRQLQSMYIFKNPRIGGDVACHQDATFLFTEPLSVTGLWFALEEATLDNGCLWALPGGHTGPLRKRFARAGGDKTTMTVVDPTPLPPVAPGLPWVPLEVPRGTMVLLHGLLPHWSGANRSARSRHAYSIHLIDEACRYPEDNWLRPGVARPSRGMRVEASNRPDAEGDGG